MFGKNSNDVSPTIACRGLTQPPPSPPHAEDCMLGPKYSVPRSWGEGAIIQIALDYWAALGHQAIAVLPEYHLSFERVGGSKRAAELGLSDAKKVADDVPLLRHLEEEGRLLLTPPQDYDDSYCLSLAQSKGGCVVSNDMYRDYVELVAKRGGSTKQAMAWCKSHVISYTFLGDEFLPNPDFVFPTE